MDAYDKSVWTSDMMPSEGYHHVVRDGERFVMLLCPDTDGVTREVFAVGAWNWQHATEQIGAFRSILALPSAEEHAALVALERAVRAQVDGHDESSITDDVAAALARLDAARKERGA